MRIVVTSQHRYQRTPDGVVWTEGKYGYSFWRRYLDAFDAVRVVARAREVATVPAEWKPVSGAGVEVWALPFVRGAWGWARNLLALRKAARAAIEPTDAVMLRAPGEVACCVDTWLWSQKRPYGVEVVGDPRELFAPGAVKSVFRPILRAIYPGRVRKECAQSACAAYVTRETLQRSYPPPAGGFSTHYSSIELGDDAFVATSRSAAEIAARTESSGVTLLFVGTFAQMYKGPDVAVAAAAECVRAGLPVRLRMCGDGKHRGEIEQQAKQAGIAERVTFLGQVPPATVRSELDQASIFISPSRQEGLPRAVIEAMARATPTIASTVGGTAELLPDDQLVTLGPAHEMGRALAAKIGVFARDAARMAQMSARNLQVSREYQETVLRERRKAMYAALRTATEKWRRG